MSEVMLKKMRSAGGISPVLSTCELLWTGLEGAVEKWAKSTLGADCATSLAGKTLLGMRDVEPDISERFGYICLPYAATGLRVIAVDRELAVRHAAGRLEEAPEYLREAPSLFLRLMADQPVRSLWKQLASAIPVGQRLPDDFSVADPAGVADSLSGSSRLFRVTLDIAGDDGDILGEDRPAPSIHLYYDYDSLCRFAADVEANMAKARQKGQGPASEGLRKRMRSSSINLDAVLEQLPMTLADCSRLEVGQVLRLPDAEPGKLFLMAATMSGNITIGKAELGNWKGRRALKLTSPILESFVQEISEI